MADVNADGHLDIYVCRSGLLKEEERRNELFINQGDGTFVEEAAKYGLDDPGYSTHAVFFDYDRDGDLDCFVLNHGLKPSFNLGIAQVKSQRVPFFGDRLYRNDGGTFTDVSAEAGIIGNAIGFGLSVTVEDFDRDGWPDLFVANDYLEQDYVYRNLGNGRFQEILDPSMAHTSHFSMGSDAGDVNRDGWPDLMVLDMLPPDNDGQKVLKGPDNYDRYQMQVQAGFYHQQMRSTLQLNLGRGLGQGQAFAEIAQMAGIASTDWSWSPLFADFDNDGDLDLHVTNGYVRASTHLDFIKYDYPQAQEMAQLAGKTLSDGEVSRRIPSIHITNEIFSNEGEGLTFRQMTKEWGLDRPSFSQGAAYGDLDLDGDLDLVVNNLKAPAFVYENLSGGRSLQLSLVGTPHNRLGQGAVVIAWIQGLPHRRMLMTTRGYQSSVEPMIHIGLGEQAQADSLHLIWPNGDFQRIGSLAAGRHIISWQKGFPAYRGLPIQPNHMQTKGFTHQENDEVEFKTQPLIPHMLGRMGPCLAANVLGPRNGEIFVGGGPGQAAMRMEYDLVGDQVNWRSFPLPGTEAAEVTDIALFDADGDGDLDLYLVVGGHTASQAGPLLEDILLLREGNEFRRAPHPLPPQVRSGACVAVGDADGDGDLDLFIGGRVKPGQYPLSPYSALLLNDGKGQFTSATEAYFGTEKLGMISDAQWDDLDGDGRAELILLGEWKSIQVFGWKDGTFQDRSAEWGLTQSTGLWNKLTIGDVDGDGDLDLICGNMGENTYWRVLPGEPLRLYAADFDRNGSIDPIMTHFLGGKEVPLASRDELLGHLRYLQKQFPRYEDYARADIHQLLRPEEIAGAQVFEARQLQSGWWEQRDGKFHFHPWPPMAQIAPVFGQVLDDLNGDGYPDVLLAGNFYPAKAETGRYDAGSGCVLYGDGKGGFRAELSGVQGIWLTGDIRDLISVPIGEEERLTIAVRNASPWIWVKSKRHFSKKNLP